MRGFVLSLAVVGTVATTACGSSGGTGFSSGASSPSSVDQIVISSQTGQANFFFLAPGGTNVPIALTAVAQNGGGVTALAANTSGFTWNARVVDPTTDPAAYWQYTTTTVPNGTVRSCPSISSPPPAGISFANLPLERSDGTPLRSGTKTTAVKYAATPGLAPPYCVLVTATYGAGAGFGAVTIVVASNPNGPS